MKALLRQLLPEESHEKPLSHHYPSARLEGRFARYGASGQIKTIPRRGPQLREPSHFLGQLTEKRWEIGLAAQGKGELSVRGLARLVGRDVKRVHEDVGILVNLGLLGRTDSGGVVCPYTSMHIDMYMKAA